MTPHDLLPRMTADDGITDALRRWLRAVDEPHQAAVMLEYLDMRDRMRAAQRAVTSLEHAAATHATIDGAIEEQRASDPDAAGVSCRAGCAACCHIPVSVTRAEGALVRAAAARAGVKLDKQRLRLQARHGEDWQALPLEQRRCTLLGDDNHCRVYDHRPGVCRKYHVASEPALCDTVSHPGARVLVWVVPIAEAAQSAAVTVWGQLTLADALLGNTRKQGCRMRKRAHKALARPCQMPTLANSVTDASQEHTCTLRTSNGPRKSGIW